MKFRTFAIAAALTLALFLFAQRRPVEPQQAAVAGVVDLTHSISEKDPTFELSAKSPYQARTVSDLQKDGYFAREISLPEHFATHVDAPAHFARGAWTVDQIPAERLVRPLVVIDVRKQAQANPDYELSVDDLANWEKANGQIPPGAVVMLHSGWDSRWYSPNSYRNTDAKGTLHFPGYSLEAAKFLVDARQVVGLGIDTLSVDPGVATNFPVHHFTAAHQVYHIENVANLEKVPDSGCLVVIAPAKLEGGSGGPVRVLALVR